MFTGIVEEQGTLTAREGGRLRFSASTVLADVTIGASISVSGCCLTVVDFGDGWWDADVVDESFARTSLGELRLGDPVNLERPMQMDGRLGGHIVQGHVDGIGTVSHAAPDLRVEADGELLRHIVHKGSITIDGVSLTVASVDETGFAVAIIPHTAEVTTFGVRRPGDHVNLEVDVISKYVERLAEPYLSARFAQGAS